jgi:hypothetical protein
MESLSAIPFSSSPSRRRRQMVETDEQFVEQLVEIAVCDWMQEQFNEFFAIARRGAAMQWRPIETAPRDGTEFLAYRPDAGVFTASYDDEQECWFANYGFEDIVDDLPTHWMPLPPPPPALGEQE